MKLLKSVFVWAIVPCLFIALFLHSFGVEQVAFDDTYYKFFSNVFQIQKTWQIAIPNIPPIPEMGIDWLDLLFGLVNGLTSFINIISGVINVLINVFQFSISIFVAIVDNLRDLFIHNIVLFN